jgi:hypothetical protein
MKRFLVVALLVAPATAGAFKVALRDEASGKPLEGAFVIAREWATVGKIHGTDDYCARADVAPVHGPFVTMDLPLAGTDMFTTARGLEAIAYRPGYCLGRTESAERIASWKYMSVGMPRPKEIDTSTETRLQMRRSEADPEERLLYLRQMLPLFSCTRDRWSSRSEKSLELFREAVVSEARTLARTRYEKALAHRLGQQVVTAEVRRVQPLQDVASSASGPTSFPRDFLVAPADVTVKWGDTGLLVAAARPHAAMQAAAPMAASPQGVPLGPPRLPQGGMIVGGGAANPARPPPPLVIHCRHGEASKCDLDERDADGRTAIFGAIYFLHSRTDDARSVNEVRTLLAAGANPTIPQRPFGATPLELALMSLLRAPPGPGRDQLAQIVDLLASDPRMTVPAALKDDFASDPSTWDVARHQPGYASLIERREAIARLPAQPERQRSCEIPTTGYSSLWAEGSEERLRLRASRPQRSPG